MAKEYHLFWLKESNPPYFRIHLSKYKEVANNPKWDYFGKFETLDAAVAFREAKKQELETFLER